MLTNTQLVTVAEITQETYATVEGLASSLNAEQESAIADDIDLWDDNKNDVDVWLSNPSGANWQAQKLLDAIRQRMRKTLGLSLVSWEVSGYSMNVGHTWIY